MALQEQAAPAARVRARTGSMESKRGWSWGTFGRYLAVALVVLVSLAPLYWTFITSIKNGIEINASPPTLFPQSSVNADNYVKDLAPSATSFFLQDLINSAIIAGITTILALVLGSLCAYAIARTKFRGKGGVLSIILSVQMIPFITMVGPLFIIFTSPGLYIYNTYAALIIPDLVITLPITVWLLTSFFRDLPPDLEEAALVDGDTRLGALWHVVIPLTAPGVFAAAILSFIAVWNDLLFGLYLTTDEHAQPVTVGITRFNGEHVIAYGQIAAAAIIVTIPLVILVLILQRRIVAGLTAGAVKG